ncbi:MAG: tetratricopeptide repeat protein [Planctomycetota bacterium]|nr:tetratricopeptide repeat protein [Planctomycetota bacterium]
MKRVALWLLLFGTALGLRAQSPDAEFLQIYNLIQEGEALESTAQPAPALERFQRAQQDLVAFTKSHPGWNPKITRFRLEYLAQRVGTLKDKVTTVVPSPAAPPVPGLAVRAEQGREPDRAPTAGAPDSPRSNSLSLELAEARTSREKAEARATAAEARTEMALRKADEATVRLNEAGDRMARLALDLRRARDRVEVLEVAQGNLEKTRDRLDRERTVLEARLKEALSPKAAAVDPAELAKAEDRILLLVKENEILKAGLDYQMTENRRIVESARKAVELEKQLQGARTELATLRRQTEELRGERRKLTARIETLTRKSEEQAGLRAELSEQRTVGEKLRREKDTLVREIQKLTDIRVSPASLKVSELPGDENAVVQTAHYRRLERERDDLVRELEAARAELSRSDRSRPGRSIEDRTRDLTREVQRLEARVGALESKPDPYSPEELALFHTPAQAPRAAPVQIAQAQPAPAQPAQPAVPAAPPTAVPPQAGASKEQPPSSSPAPTGAGTASPSTSAASATNAGSTNRPAVSRRRTIRDLPPGASVLASQAQRAFSQRRLDDAERAYREILKIDENNVFTLGNLAAIIVELGRVEEGETILNRALALDSQDPFSLSLLGILRFRQQRYDDALNALSEAAQLDPEDPATQTYLGITLSERGQRTAAEAALRKALKLSPGSAAAHYNLSVVYATQKPPFLELARYHYEKSRRAGQPANPAFEAVLRGETGPASPVEPPVK